MRVAVVDVGSNSTRLLIADVDAHDRRVRELVRRSTVTRLGQGVDETGTLCAEAIDRVLAALDGYVREIGAHHVEAAVALFTSAVREASNGRSFADRVHAACGLHARVLSGDEEAQLTFWGAMASRAARAQPTVVIDIGGGSTEFTIGTHERPRFHVSVPAGVVRMSERHIRSDPPTRTELARLAEDSRTIFGDAIPTRERGSAAHGIAVAGTATSAAAIEQRLEPYDPERVDGYVLARATVRALLARVGAMSEQERRGLAGLQPQRAPTIIAGLALLSEALDVFALEEVEVSEHDILHGAALELAAR